VGTGIAAAVTKVRQFVSAVGIGFGLDAVASDMQRGFAVFIIYCGVCLEQNSVHKRLLFLTCITFDRCFI
jgi:hypothetical protein